MIVINGGSEQVQLDIVDDIGNTDGIHVQPRGRVELAEGWQCSPASLEQFPSIRVENPSVKTTSTNTTSKAK